MAGGMKPERQYRHLLDAARNLNASFPEADSQEAYARQATSKAACLSAASFSDRDIYYSRNAGALIKCLYCGRTNQLDDKTSCPGCGAPIIIEGEHP